MSTLHGYLIVFLGAGLGGSLRHAVNRALFPLHVFPWATFAVNVSGSLAMGMVAGWFALRAAEPEMPGGLAMAGASGQHFRLFLTTGLLGGYTTFSAFSLDAVLLWERGRAVSAAAYAGASVVVSIVALLIGIALTRA